MINVVAFLDEVPLGAEFTPGDMPLHVTLVPWAVTEVETGAVEAAVASVLAGRRSLVIEGGDAAQFGSDGDIEVTLVEDDGSLMRLHVELVRVLQSLGVRVLAPEHLGSAYRPHVTVRRDGRLERGRRTALAAIALFTRDDGPWRLVARFPLI